MRITTHAVLLTAALAAAGCNSTIRLPFAQKATSAVGLDRVFNLNRDQLASAHGDRQIATHMTPPKKSFWQRIGLGSKPRVVQPDDPTRLGGSSIVGADVHLGAAKLHEQRGDVAAAAKSYAQALQVDEDNEGALLSFARLYDRNDRFEDAERLYKRAVEKHPESSRAHNDYGLCLVRQERTPEGLKELSRAVELSPGEPRYRNNIAQVLAGAGRIEDALEHLRSVHSDAEAHYNVAYWLRSSGNHDAALSHYVKAAELDPQFGAAHAMVAQLQHTVAVGAPQRQQAAPYVGQTPGPAVVR